MLSTYGWQKILDEEEGKNTQSGEGENEDAMSAIDRLAQRFQIPLEKAGAAISEIRCEFELTIAYASQYISISTMEYRAVWWHLFHAPNSSEWSNVLILSQLLFSLPVSNGKLERIFSQVNLIKSSKRASIGSDALVDLVTLNTDKLALSDFSPDGAIDL